MNSEGTLVICFATDAYTTRNYSRFLSDLDTNLSPYRIKLLINADKLPHDSTQFHLLPFEEIQRHIIQGIEIPTLVMQKCLSVMQNFSSEKECAILNISSGRCVGPAARDNKFLYGATKAFMDYLSRGASLEYKKKGIHVHSVR